MFNLTRSPELSLVEVIILEQIYLLLNRLDRLTKTITENTDNYDKVVEAAREMKYINSYNGSLELLKDQFFQHASFDTLRKIASEEKFKSESRYTIDGFIIPKVVLKSFKYGSEIKSTDPKADIAKKLGAKIVL